MSIIPPKKMMPGFERTFCFAWILPLFPCDFLSVCGISMRQCSLIDCFYETVITLRTMLNLNCTMTEFQFRMTNLCIILLEDHYLISVYHTYNLHNWEKKKSLLINCFFLNLSELWTQNESSMDMLNEFNKTGWGTFIRNYFIDFIFKVIYIWSWF